MSDLVYFKGPIDIRAIGPLPNAGAFDPDPVVPVDTSYLQSVEISIEYTGAGAANRAAMSIEVFDGVTWRPLGVRNPTFVAFGALFVNDIVDEILRFPAGTSVILTLPPLRIEAQQARFRFAEVGDIQNPGTLSATLLGLWVRR